MKNVVWVIQGTNNIGVLEFMTICASEAYAEKVLEKQKKI